MRNPHESLNPHPHYFTIHQWLTLQTRMSTLQGSLAIEQLTEERYAECCEFFRIDPATVQDPSVDRISIKGLKRRFFIHQIYAVYWALKHERLSHARGGFIADEMGLGKVPLPHNTVLLSLSLYYPKT